MLAFFTKLNNEIFICKILHLGLLNEMQKHIIGNEAMKSNSLRCVVVAALIIGLSKLILHK